MHQGFFLGKQEIFLCILLLYTKALKLQELKDQRLDGDSLGDLDLVRFI